MSTSCTCITVVASLHDTSIMLSRRKTVSLMLLVCLLFLATCLFCDSDRGRTDRGKFYVHVAHACTDTCPNTETQSIAVVFN